jgi:hypothetical protein
MDPVFNTGTSTKAGAPQVPRLYMALWANW